MRIESLDLHITDRCNLRCDYCYLYRQDYVRRPDIDESVIRFLPQVVEKLGVKRINFFGGEPMLAFEKIQQIVELLKPKGVRFHIATNGTVCTPEQSQFLKAHQISVQRSIDGCREACEKNRPGVNEKYLELTDLFRDRGKARRSTIAEDAAKYLYHSWLYLKTNGFNQGWTPVPDNYSEWKPESIQAFLDGLRAIARDLVADAKAGKRPFYNFWFQRVAQSMLSQNRESPKGCGAGRTLLALRQDGFFFACHRFVSDDVLSDWCFGHVADIIYGSGLRPGPSAAEAIRKCREEPFTAAEFAECEECPVRAACPGGCYHTNRAVTGNAAQPTRTWCELRRGTLPIVQWIHAQIGDAHPLWWQGIRGKVATQPTQNMKARQQVHPPQSQQMRSQAIGNAACSARCAKRNETQLVIGSK